MKTLVGAEESLGRVRSHIQRGGAALGGRIGDHLAGYLGRPGKMIRARYSLLLGACLGVETGAAERVAAVAELVHNASLLHDDCIDDGLLRRGLPTPNALFGDRAGVLLGNLCFTEALSEARRLSSSAAQALVEAASEMSVGELQEEFLRGSTNLSAEGYCGLAVRKTGSVFEWAGKALSGLSPERHRPQDPVRLGRLAGIILQIVDDVHDFALERDVAGKEPGQDLRNGRLTLPCILALDDEDARPRMLRIWASREKPEALGQAMELFMERGFLAASRAKAREALEEALPVAEGLPVRERASALAGFLKRMLEREF